ncbi:hypothetical protein [Methanomassiliicoccus luminyensis]|uniref:hypothetical protein n=1 Tax=Methanomassiliicoccus luminyensis TaxID=1080712 RepID=UPI000366711F|nr:hypothetical protein [Methanomassiliicoccus luminyensis]
MAMGRYYIAVSHARKEYVDPTEIESGAKKGEILDPSGGVTLAHVAAFLIFDRWKKGEVEFVPDDDPLYQRIIQEYTDIGAEMAKAWNAYWSRCPDYHGFPIRFDDGRENFYTVIEGGW